MLCCKKNIWRNTKSNEILILQKLLTAEGQIDDFTRPVRDLKATVIEAMTELKTELETRYIILKYIIKGFMTF